MRFIQLPHKKINLIFGTDIHISATPPGRRADNYMEAIFSKLDFVKRTTEENNGVFICGGDIFHIKNPRSPSNPLSMIERLINLFGSFPTKAIYSAVGNHDLSYDNMGTLPGQPMGILIASGVCHNLVKEPVCFTNGEVKVLVESFPYCSEEELLPILLATGPRPEGIDYRIGVIHAFGHPNPTDATFGKSDFPYNPIGYKQLANLDYDVLCWGHDHSRKETVTVGGITHVNFGSIARAALIQDEVDRPVCLALLSCSKDKLGYKEIEIPVKPLDVVFDKADKAVSSAKSTDEVTDFFSTLNSSINEIDSSDPREVIEKLCKNDKVLYDNILEICEF